MIIPVTKIIAEFEKALNEKWGYIWGEAGDVWTAKKQNAATRAMTIKYGSKWIGKRVADCSGLFAYVFEKLGGEMYHGSNTMWNKYCTDKGTLKNGKRTDGLALAPGSAVFKTNESDGRYHVGLWTGKYVIEAKSTEYGVVNTTPLSKWNEWGMLKGVDYNAIEEDYDKSMVNNVTYPTVRQGDRGDLVYQLQDMLAGAGSGLTVDGIFGIGTLSAVKSFQKRNGLDVDGVVGPKTWAKLLEQNNIHLGTTTMEPAKEEAELELTEAMANGEFTIEEKVDIIWRFFQNYLNVIDPNSNC